MYSESPLGLQQKLFQARRERYDILKMLKEKTANQESSTQLSCPSGLNGTKSFPDK